MISDLILNFLNMYLSTENTLAIFPIARILFLITSFRRFAAVPENYSQNFVIPFIFDQNRCS